MRKNGSKPGSYLTRRLANCFKCRERTWHRETGYGRALQCEECERKEREAKR